MIEITHASTSLLSVAQDSPTPGQSSVGGQSGQRVHQSRVRASGTSLYLGSGPDDHRTQMHLRPRRDRADRLVAGQGTPTGPILQRALINRVEMEVFLLPHRIHIAKFDFQRYTLLKSQEQRSE
jgi:hypothetical protein